MATLSDLELLRQARRLGYTLENEDEILQREAQRLGFNLVGPQGQTAPAPIFNAPSTPPTPPTTIGGELVEVLKGLPRGAVGLLETAASGAAALLPDQAERELRGEITEFFQPAREALAPAAGYEESIGARAGEALGSTLPFLAAGPFGLAGRAAATGLGVAAGAGEARLRAEQEGGMEDRGTATALGALVGATEVLPIFRILDRLPQKEALQVFDYVKRAAAAGGEEFAQEASANVAQNLIAKGLYKPDQEVFEGAAEEGAYGFGVGAFIQGLTDLAMGRRVRGGVAPPGGEDERAGIGAEPPIEGADTGGIELPVSRIGAAGPDVEGVAPAGMGVSREPVGRVDEGEAVLQPALRFQRGEEEPSNVVSMQERRAAQIDAEEEAEDLADYNEGIVSSRERLLETYTPTINTIRAFIDYGQNVLENTKYPNSLEAAELERQLPYLQKIVDRFEPLETGVGVDQEYLSNWYGNTAWLESNLKNVIGERGELNVLQKFAEEIAPRPKLKKGQKEVSKVVQFRPPETIQPEATQPEVTLPKSSAIAFEPAKLEELRVPEYKSREKLIEMPIDDFLALAKPGRMKIKEDEVTKLLDEGTKFSSIPFLNAYPTKEGTLKVEGHEGRHRARALKAAGYETMPVIIRSDIRWSEQDDPSKRDYMPNWPTKIVAQEGNKSIPMPISREQSTAPYEVQQPAEPKFQREEPSDYVYHVTRTESVPKIEKKGLLPMQTSNWVKAGSKERYGEGDVYVFSNKEDAQRWAAKMDWDLNEQMGSGKVSVVTVQRPKGIEFDVDKNDPFSQAGSKGPWLKTKERIPSENIVSAEPFDPKVLRQRAEEPKFQRETPAPKVPRVKYKSEGPSYEQGLKFYYDGRYFDLSAASGMFRRPLLVVSDRNGNRVGDHYANNERRQVDARVGDARQIEKYNLPPDITNAINNYLFSYSKGDAGVATAGKQVADVVNAEMAKYDTPSKSQLGEVPTAPKVPLERVQATVQEATRGWANAPKIIVAQNANDPVIPEPLRRQIPANARGFYDQGSVYVLADRAPSESAVRGTVFHESLGHYGLEQLFRSRLDQTLDSIYKTNTAVKAEADRWMKKFPDAYAGPNQAIRAVEEILAGRAEKGVIKEPGIRAAFNRLAAMIRKFLRGMGLAKTYTNNDINNILLEAAERVRSQPGPVFNTDASPRFQQRQYNTTLANVITQNQRLPEWSQGVGDGVAQAMSKMPENLRKTQFYIYSMPQVIELLERYTPRIKAIDRFIGYRASYTTDLMKTASDNHAKYTRVVREYPDKYEDFKNVVNDINLFQVQVRDQSVIDLLSQPRASLNSQKQKYYDVAKRFYDLPVPMQNAILSSDGESGLFADYRKMADKKMDIFEQVYGGQLGMGFVRELRERFNRERLPMYAPLVRGEGTHWLYYETTDGRSYKEIFKTQAAREAAIKKVLDEGLANPDTIVRATRPAELREKGPPPSGFLGDVVRSLEARLPETMPAAERKEIIDSIYETFLSYMPSNMLRQELSSRETFDVDGVRQFGVLGFDQDVLAVYERTMPKMAYQLGNLKFALPIENAMKKVMEQAKLYEIAYRENNLPTRLQGRRVMTPQSVFDGVEDMRRRVNFAYNPSYAPWVNASATANYIYSIAGNVSSALINTTVLAMMTFPSLVARYGVIKASAAMARASKMFAEGGVDDQGNFTFGNSATGEVKTFFDYLTKRGVIGIAAEQELRQAQRAKVSGYESTLDKINFALGYVFKNSERFNREVTMLSSFMLAREKGKSFKTAAEEAIRLNNNINGTVLPESASRLYQTNLGRVILTFRTFALTQIINLSRAFGQAMNVVDATLEERSIARKQLLGIYGMTYMVAGLKGLPLFSAAEVLAAALMGDDDEPYDLQQEVLDSMGLLGLNGPLNAAFNVDIASRTGFNGMLWRDDPKRLAELGFVYYAIDRLAGPTAGLIQAQVRGIEKLAEGDIQRGFESILPAPLRNPLKAARYATEGALTKDGLPIVDDVNTWNTVMQVFGFAPSELAATQEQIGAKFAISDKLRSRRTALLTNLYTAMSTGDAEATQKAFEDIDKFNTTNPMIGINPKSIQASFRERNRRAIESINGIYLPRNLLATTEEYMADYN